MINRAAVVVGPGCGTTRYRTTPTKRFIGQAGAMKGTATYPFDVPVFICGLKDSRVSTEADFINVFRLPATD